MYRLPFFALALLGLVTGVWAGIIRLGFDLPGIDWATLHGPLMVGGFVGTIIGIERSILSGNAKWAIIPLLSGLSVVAWLVGFAKEAPWLLAGSAVLLVVMQGTHLFRGGLSWVSAIQMAGAACFLGGNLRLLFDPFMPAIVPWWMGFVLCFILATRLADTSFREPFARWLVRSGLTMYLAGLLIPFHLNGYYLTGTGLILIAVGMIVTETGGSRAPATAFDIYSIAATVAGWWWLLIAGIGLTFWKEHLYGYDATVHAFFLGFLFSMVFLHALGKAAALASLPHPPFHPILFVWLVLLSASLAVRIFAGDILLMEFVKRWAGIFNGVSILGFLVSLIVLTFIRKSQNSHGPL